MDLNRNACTFESPEHLILFIQKLKKHNNFGGHPVRIKNMFLLKEEEAKANFFYRTVMVNWCYTPGFTFKDMANMSQGLWDSYLNYASVPGYGEKDPSESPSTWRKQIKAAMAFLTSDDLKDRKVQLVVETQLLLRPYLEGRTKMHFLYKICRASSPTALHNDFQDYAKLGDQKNYNDLSLKNPSFPTPFTPQPFSTKLG